MSERIDFSIIIPTRDRHTQLAACLDVEAGADFRDMLNHLAASGLISCRSV